MFERSRVGLPLLVCVLSVSAFVVSRKAYEASISAHASGVPTGFSMAWAGGALCAGLVGAGCAVVALALLFSTRRAPRR